MQLGGPWRAEWDVLRSRRDDMSGYKVSEMVRGLKSAFVGVKVGFLKALAALQDGLLIEASTTGHETSLLSLACVAGYFERLHGSCNLSQIAIVWL